MTKRIVLAALLGGVAMFIWEGLAHEVLPLGEAGIRGLDNEPAVMATLKDTVKQSGFYIFPGGEVFQPGLSGAQKKELMAKSMEKWKTGPSGIMVVQANGADTLSPAHLGLQCLFDIAVALLAALLLSAATALSSFGARLLFVTAIGLVPTLCVELAYWNWYGFPATYVMAQAVEHLVGFLAAGLVIAKLVKATGGSGDANAARAAA